MKSLIIALSFLSLTQAHAWGPVGHKAVATMAWEKLTSHSREQIIALLGSKENFIEGANWADSVRNTEEFKHTTTWHYINWIEGNTQYTHNPLKKEGDAIQALILETEILRNQSLSVSEHANAVKFITHIVGDMHMPMHVGKAADLGGNLVKVQFRGQSVDEKGKEYNLHRLWDNELVTELFKTTTIEQIQKLPFQPMQNENYLMWADESQSLLLNFVYHVSNQNIDEEYILCALPIIQMRLALAGQRLAGELNAALSGTPETEGFVNAKEEVLSLCSDGGCILRP